MPTDIRFYVATTFDNWPEAKRYADALEAAGMTLALDWWKYHPANMPSTFRPDLSAIALAEVAAIVSSSVLIVLMPGGRGTHTELGVAIASGASVVLVGPEVGDTDHAAVPFYWLPNVMRVAMPSTHWALADMVATIRFSHATMSSRVDADAVNWGAK